MPNPNIELVYKEWRDGRATHFQVHPNVDEALAAARELAAERS